MNEVSIQLQGGLGNYLFQISCVYAYCLKYKKEFFFTTEDSVLVHKSIDYYKSNILNRVNFLNAKKMSGKVTMYNEPTFNFTEIPQIEGNVYLRGYFQSELYFKEYENEIKQLFFQPTHVIDKVINNIALDSYNVKINEDNTCSIHVRRGDYLNSPNHHPTQNMNYYMKAIKQMPKDSVFLIFSDDMAWCKENFPDIPEKFKFIEGTTDYEDILLMSLCKNNIITNSTFSWWGAWLNQNKEKIVIAPKTWFGSAYSNYSTKDLYCENWIQI